MEFQLLKKLRKKGLSTHNAALDYLMNFIIYLNLIIGFVW